jgi:hypothetical protein
MSGPILYPLFALVALTFAVAFWMGGLRFRAVARRQVHIRYFRLNAGQEVPPRVAQAANHYRNLFELPVLFYALIGVLLATGRADAVQVGLAWAFVASRYVHSFIHLSYNNVLHRFAAFATGLLILLAMWVRLGLQVAAG